MGLFNKKLLYPNKWPFIAEDPGEDVPVPSAAPVPSSAPRQTNLFNKVPRETMTEETTTPQGADLPTQTQPSNLDELGLARPDVHKPSLFGKIAGVALPALVGALGGAGALTGAAEGGAQLAARERGLEDQALKQYQAERLKKLADLAPSATQKDFAAYKAMSPEDQALYGNFKEAGQDQMLKLLNYNLGRDRLTQSANDRQAQREQNQSQFTDRSIERLQGKLGNSQDAVNTLGEVKTQMGFDPQDYDPATNTANGKKVDLPGVSGLGLGRISFYSGKARELENTAQKLFNIQIKDRSGAAVTSNEMERLKDEWSRGKFNDESELIKAMARYERALQEAMRNQEAGFSPEFVSELANRGGVTSKSIKGGNRTAPQHSKEDIEAEIRRRGLR